MYDTTDGTGDWLPDRLAGCSQVLQALFAYWDQKRGARAMPSRPDIDPLDIKALLSHLILIDVVPDSRRYVYRLVGTREVEIRGSDPTGKAVADAAYAQSAEEALWYLDRVKTTRQPVLYRGTYQPLPARIHREEVLFLPLSRDSKTVDMILVCGHILWTKD